MNTLETALLSALPHVVSRRILRYREMRRLGTRLKPAMQTAFVSSRYAAVKKARLDLLPSGTLQDLHCVVDVGANEGKWSEALLRQAPVKQLVAIEPNPVIFAGLQKRLARFSNVRCLKLAVGAAKGTLPFHNTQSSLCSSFLRPREEMRQFYGEAIEPRQKIQVPVERLDNVLTDFARISLLKIDVQGYERQVLQGASEVLRRTNRILIEANFVSHYQDDILFPELHRLLTGAGFALANLSPPFQKENLALWADALYHARKTPACVS
ncbi:MAG: FkbM family methyltransferase [Verrucomicrobiota bacterium]